MRFVPLIFLLAGCSFTAGGLHQVAYYPSGACQRVELEGVGASPTRVWVEGDPVPRSLPTALPPTLGHGQSPYLEPPTPGEALRTAPWQWRGDLRMGYGGGGTVQYRLTCLPYGLPSLLTPPLPTGGEVALVVVEDEGSPSRLRVWVVRR